MIVSSHFQTRFATLVLTNWFTVNPSAGALIKPVFSSTSKVSVITFVGMLAQSCVQETISSQACVKSECEQSNQGRGGQ